MNQRRFTWGYSQFLASSVVALAVLMMLAPFRGASKLTKMRTAGVLPILSTASIAHGASFQAFHSSERICVSEVSLFRSAFAAKASMRREIVVRKSAGPLPDQFEAPRTGWRHLDRATRARLDELATHWGGNTIELRSTGMRKGGLPELERVHRALFPAALEKGTLLIGNGAGFRNGAVAAREGAPAPERPLVLFLAGDFHCQTPTSAQWEALDEVLDYLELKCGKLALKIPGADAAESTRTALGPFFPVESLMRAVSVPEF